MELRTYQSQMISTIKSDISAGQELIVMAMCPNSGKTFTSIKLVEDLLDSGSFKKVLVLAHATTVLRSQFYQSIVDIQPNFTFKEISPEDKSTDAQVLVAIPQGLKNVNLKGVDLLIVDEAHEWYLTAEGKEFRKTLNPKHQILLTGTPSKFIYENSKKPGSYKINLVAMSDIPADNMANAQVFICSSKYDIKEEDYNDSEEVNGAYKFKKKQTEDTLDLFLEQMHKFLKMKTITSLDNLFPMSFDKLHKTMFACKSQQQAKQVADYLNRKGVNVLVSTEDNDKNSENINKFVEDSSVKVLVVVNRGILGFNLPTLANVVDMTGTRNLDRMYQLFSRITRTDKNIDVKRYFKIAPAEEVEYTDYVTSAMLSLIHRDNIEVYNGKNFRTDVPILVKKSERKSGKGGKSKSKSAPKLHEFQGIDVIRVFTKVYSNLDKELQVYSKTSLGEVRKRIGMSESLPNGYWTLERIVTVSKECASGSEFGDKYPGALTASVSLGVYNEIRKLNNWPDGKSPVKVQCLQTGEVFSSIKQAAYNLGTSTQGISAVLYGRQKSTKGLTFKTITSEEDITTSVVPKMTTSQPKSKPIECLETGDKYNSVYEAAISMGLHRVTIKDVLKGKQKSTKGYTFKYVEEDEDGEE